MKGKQILSFITSGVMAVTLFGDGLAGFTDKTGFLYKPMTGSAESYSSDIAYGSYLTIQKVDEDEDGTYDYACICDCNTSAVSVDIPSEVAGLPVTNIGNETFYLCTSLESITIPDRVMSIGYHVFDDCTSLESINVSEENLSYLSIDGVLFDKEATELIKYPAGKSGTEYVTPDSVTSIGDWAFWDCTSLSNMTIPDSVTSIGDYAFYGCTSLSSIKIPHSVTSIGDMAFHNCSSLTSISIPDSVTSIGWSAFSNCTSLESVTIGNGVTSIGEMAFIFCESLACIMIPDRVTNIGDDAFCRCASLESINVSEGNLNYSSLDGVLFNKEATELIRYPEGKSGTEYAIPDSVKCIGWSAFYYCTNLGSVTIPDSVTSIGSSAFSDTALLDNQTGVKYADTWIVGCDTDVTSVAIKEGTKGIADHAFYSTNLESVTIPDSVTSIGIGTFEYCNSLERITIPDSVMSIGREAFFGCSSLRSITIMNPECEIYDDSATISSVNNYNNYFNSTIYGYNGSTAQAYAEKYRREFVSLDGEPDTTQGDANGDDIVNVRDAAFIASKLAQGKSGELPDSADFNGDGNINVRDAAAIAKYLAAGSKD
ncbi:MAG: leucine-rich repeat protein [Porcipelethomonas sp.]